MSDKSGPWGPTSPVRPPRAWIGAARSNVRTLLMTGLPLLAVIAYAAKDMSGPDRFAYYRDLYVKPKLTARLCPNAYGDEQGVRHAVLSVRGEIGAAAAPWFKAETTKARLKAGDTILLSSPGGSVDEAMIMGLQIRAKGFETAVGTIDAAGLLRPSFCASACVLAFAGGRRRVGIRGARLGVHRFTMHGDVADLVAATQRTMESVSTYLEQAGMTPSLMRMMASTDAIRWLDAEESATTHLIDVPAGGSASGLYADQQVCAR